MLAFRLHAPSASYQIQTHFSIPRTQKRSSCFCPFMSILPPRDCGNSINLLIVNFQDDYTCWNGTWLHIIHPNCSSTPGNGLAFQSKLTRYCTPLACSSLKRIFCFLKPTPCAAAGVAQTGINPSAMPFRKLMGRQTLHHFHHTSMKFQSPQKKILHGDQQR